MGSTSLVEDEKEGGPAAAVVAVAALRACSMCPMQVPMYIRRTSSTSCSKSGARFWWSELRSSIASVATVPVMTMM